MRDRPAQLIVSHLSARFLLRLETGRFKTEANGFKAGRKEQTAERGVDFPDMQAVRAVKPAVDAAPFYVVKEWNNTAFGVHQKRVVVKTEIRNTEILMPVFDFVGDFSGIAPQMLFVK